MLLAKCDTITKESSEAQAALQAEVPNKKTTTVVASCPRSPGVSLADQAAEAGADGDSDQGERARGEKRGPGTGMAPRPERPRDRTLTWRPPLLVRKTESTPQW